METKPKRARRTPAEWQRVIDEQTRSGLSQERFCRQHNIGFSSFYRWKEKLAEGVRHHSTRESRFIELPPLASVPASRWDIELDLGHGMVLRLRRAS